MEEQASLELNLIRKENELNILIIGDDDVGKMCMILQFVDPEFEYDLALSLEDEFKPKSFELSGNKVQLQLFELPNNDYFQKIVKSHYEGRLGVILAYDITKESSFKNVIKWREDVLLKCPNKIPHILVGNKCDVMAWREVTKINVINYAFERDLVFLETSSKTGKNIKEMFYLIIEKMIKNFNTYSQKPEIALENKYIINIGKSYVHFEKKVKTNRLYTLFKKFIH